MRRWASALLFVLAALPGAVAAQALETNDFRVDLTQTLVLGSGRAIGLGGALTAIAPGIDGVAWNPAAYAHRERHQLTRFDWSPTLSVSFPGVFHGEDFFNNGLGRTHGIEADRSAFADVGVGFLHSNVGWGVVAHTQIYELTTGTGEQVDISSLTVRGGIGHSFLGGDVVVGFGTRISLFDVETGRTGFGLFQLVGAGVEVGAQVRPEGRPWAFGVAARTPVRTSIADPGGPTESVGGFVLPISVMLPWEVQVGLAYQFGARPFHLRYRPRPDAEWTARLSLLRQQCERERAQAIFEGRAPAGEVAALPTGWDGAECLGPILPPEDRQFWTEELERRRQEERGMRWRTDRMRDAFDVSRQRAFEDLPRHYLLLAADLIVYGRVPDAIGIDAYIDQERRRRAEEASFGFRFGIEGEPWRNRLKLRAGTYTEPGRNSGVGIRPHFTAGFDLRLFRWAPFGADSPWNFRIGPSLDVARDYLDLGLGIGFWH